MASGGAASCVNHAPCPSLLFPLGYFECEVIERVEIVWGVRQIAVSLEILELDFNLDECLVAALVQVFKIRRQVSATKQLAVYNVSG